MTWHDSKTTAPHQAPVLHLRPHPDLRPSITPLLLFPHRVVPAQLQSHTMLAPLHHPARDNTIDYDERSQMPIMRDCPQREASAWDSSSCCRECRQPFRLPQHAPSDINPPIPVDKAQAKSPPPATDRLR